MDVDRGAVFAVTAVVLLVTVSTGPLGPLDVSTQRFGGEAPGTGNVTVTSVSIAGQPTLEPGRQGGDVYYLRVPDAEVEIPDLTGNPSLTYSLDIEAFAYSRSSVHFLGPAGPGTRGISLARDTFEADRIDRDAYPARLELVLRGNDTERTVYNETTTVEVLE